MKYKINIVSSYIWVESILNVFSIESKNTKKNTSDEEVMAVRSWRTKQDNPMRRTSRGLLFSFSFRHNLSQVALINIWVDSIFKGLSIESKNSNNGILTKELYKLQAMKKISNFQHLQQQQQSLFLVIFGCSINSISY